MVVLVVVKSCLERMCRAVDGGEFEFVVWSRLHHTKLIGIKKMVVMMIYKLHTNLPGIGKISS